MLLHKKPVQIAIVVVIVLACSLLGTLFAASPMGGDLENRAIDGRFLARNSESLKLLGIYNPPPITPDIVILGLDRRTYETIEDISLAWNPFYATVFKHVCEGGCKALGIDLLQTVPLDDQLKVSGGDQQLAEAIAGCPHIVLVYPIKPAVKAGTTDRQAGKSVAPTDTRETTTTFGVPQYSIFKPVLSNGDEGLGSMNLIVDPDGSVRSHALFRGVEAEANGEVESRPVFAFQLLHHYTGAEVNGDDIHPGVPYKMGPYTIPWDKNFIMRINYVGPGFSFHYESFVDALEHAKKDDKQWFKDKFGGKIVLVGEADPLVFADMKTTPYFGVKHENTPGIEIHANVLNTIITQRFLKELTPTQGFIMTLALAAVTGAAIYMCSPGLTVYLLLGILAIFGWVEMLVFSRLDTMLPVMSPFFGIAMSGLLVLLLRIMVVDKHAATIRGVFEKYVTPQVVEEILKDPHGLKMGGEKITATVVFTDINNFTTMSHDMDAQEVITFLNEYFEIMTEICMRHKGTLQSFLGDGLMIIFGAPVKMEDHALRACQMGIEMMEAQELLAKDRLEKGKQAYWIKIGINTGPVVAGNLGSHLRMEYTSIGDAVNMAARIQDATKAVGCDVLMSASTAELVKDQIDCIDRGGVKVKGVDEPIHVYEVVGIKGSTHPRPKFPGKAPLKMPTPAK